MVELSKLKTSEETQAALKAELETLSKPTSLSEAAKATLNVESANMAAYRRLSEEARGAYGTELASRSISQSLQDLSVQSGLQETLERINRPFVELEERVRQVTNPFSSVTDLSQRIHDLTRPLAPVTELGRKIQDIMKLLQISESLRDSLKGIGDLSAPNKDALAKLDIGTPANDLPGHDLAEAPVYQPRIADFKLPPHPAHKTNELLEDMIVRTDQLLTVQAQQSAVIQELAKLTATSLDEARISAAEAAKATKSAARSEKLARWAIYIAVIGLLTSVAFSTLQTWMAWQSGSESEVTLQSILKAVSPEAGPDAENVPLPGK